MMSTKKKSISITCVESDQIVQHILPLKDAENVPRRRKVDCSTGGLTYSDNFSTKKSQPDENDDSDSDFEYRKESHSQAVENDGVSIAGDELFKFRTPKKSGQMVLKAGDSSPITPKRKSLGKIGSPKSSPKTPTDKNKTAVTPPRNKRTPKRFSDAAAPGTPKLSNGVAALRDHKRMETSTPYRLRKRNLDLQEPASSSDDSVDESSTDEEEEDAVDDAKSRISTKRSAEEDLNMAANAEAYFDLHSMTPITSDRTLSTLDGPRLDVDTIRDALKKVDVGHRKQIDALMDKHNKLFKKWMFNMCCGYNILLHGLGSKRTLLEKFREQHLVKFSHLVVNGYFPSLTIKHILNSITEEILESTKGFTNIYSQLEFIQDAYRNNDEDFYLVIHNIDGVLLRAEKSQAILSLLAEIEGFHIIASIDHINAVFMWDQNKYFRFRWLWYDTPTFLPYESENAYENSLMVQQSGALALSSIMHVMRSLTPNARQVFLMLVEYQLEEGDRANYGGMSFQSLYHKCREAFLVNSDLTLQAQLVEFRDHRLIRSKKNYEGIEHLIIPVDKATLKEFLTEHKNGLT